MQFKRSRLFFIFIFFRRDVTFNYFRKISFLLHYFFTFFRSLFLSFYTSCGFFVTFRFEILRILFMLLVFWRLFEQQQKQEAIRRCRFRNRFHSSITLELKCESFFFCVPISGVPSKKPSFYQLSNGVQGS